jgi:hypothetical protein
MDSLLECLVPGVRGFLLLHSIMLVLKSNATRDPRWAIFIRIDEPLGVRRPRFRSHVIG